MDWSDTPADSLWALALGLPVLALQHYRKLRKTESKNLDMISKLFQRQNVLHRVAHFAAWNHVIQLIAFGVVYPINS